MRNATLALLVTLLLPAVALAGATKNTENSAIGVGMADAQVGVSREPAANYYNPAALTNLKHSALSLGVAPLALTGHFEARRNVPQGAATPELRRGAKEDQVLPIAPLPHAYGVWRINDPSLAVGLGIYSPWATGSQFPDDWAGRAQGVKSLVLAYAINPNVAWEPIPTLSLAVGGSFVQSSLEIEEALRPVVGNPSEDIAVHIATDGQGYQGNAALLWRPHEKLSVGVSYRTAIKVDMDGVIDFDSPNPLFAGALPDQDVTTTFRFPDTLNFGVGLFPSPSLTLDVEAEFVRYVVNQDQRIALSTGRPEAALVIPNDWENIVAYRLGAEWAGSRWWTFRAGTGWDPTPVPVERTDPLTPDADRVLFALGSTYQWHSHGFSLGLQLQHFLDRTINDAAIAAGAPDLPGTYRSDLYVVGLDWTYAFD